MNRLKNYIANIDMVSVFVLGGYFIGVIVLIVALALAAHRGNVKEGKERALVVEQCIEATPNDHNAIEHCMMKYDFIIGK